MRKSLLLLIPLAALVLMGVEVASFPQYLEVLGRQACASLSVAATDADVELASGTRYRVVSSTDVFLRVNAAATTDGTSVMVLEGQPEMMTFGPTGGGVIELHGITASGTGTVNLCPVTTAR